jgi:hypothetical protein
LDLTLISLWVHVPAVTAWIGIVMFDVFAAAAPGLDSAQRGRIITWSRPLMLLLIVLIMITGVRQTIDNPFLRLESFGMLSELRERTYGLALFWKHIFVVVTFALTLIVKFVLAPRLLPRAAVAGGGTASAGGQTERMVLWRAQPARLPRRPHPRHPHGVGAALSRADLIASPLRPSGSRPTARRRWPP